MKLPFSFFKKEKKEESEYYLALLLTDEKVSAVILQNVLEKLQVVGKHEEFFSSSLESTDIPELIGILDKTISRAEEVLPPNIETHKTVFGLKDAWIDAESKKIKKDYLVKLKKICDSLDLTPMGFMVVGEAISNLLQEEEGAPLSAILAEIGKKTVYLSLFRGGKVVEKTDGLIEEGAPETVDKLLKNFTSTVLPARIILYDAKDPERLSQSFLGYQWSKSLPFLHVPQILVLPEGADAKAVIFGAGEQMGLKVAGIDLSQHDGDKISLSPEGEKTSIEEQEVDKDEVKELGQDDSISSDNFGFVQDQDIAKIIPPKEAEEKAEKESAPGVSLDQEQEESLSEEGMEEEIMEKKTKNKKLNILSMLPAISLPKISIPFGSGKNRNTVFALGIVAGIFVVVGAVTYFYFSIVKANIVISVKPKVVSEATTVTFSSSGSSDFSKNILATKPIEATVDGDITIDTTGKKDIGDKAKGKVTIYNNDDKSVKLISGDSIKSSNGLFFVIDKDVNISSASGDVFSGTKPGTADVAVTAKDIGTDYNLPSGTKFTIGSSSTLAAKNDSAFSGGTKKQVQVVSKNDVAKLRSDLAKNLESKARDDISKKTESDEVVLPFLLNIGSENEKFDKNVNDEAKKVHLTASIKFQGQAYKKSEMLDLSKTLLKSKYSSDIVFAENSVEASVKSAKETHSASSGQTKKIEAELVVSAGLLPNINLDEIKQKASNQSLKETNNMLSNQPQVASTQVNFSPPVLFLPNLFPKLPNNINVEIKTE